MKLWWALFGERGHALLLACRGEGGGASTASGQCWSLTANCPVPGPVPTSPANRDYAAGFAGCLMLKDLRLAGAAVAEHGVSTPLGARATEIYTEWPVSWLPDRTT